MQPTVRGGNALHRRARVHAGPVRHATPVAAPPAAPAGNGRICVKRKFNAVGSAIKWTIQLDGETVGTVGAGNEQCFVAPAGTHKVAVTFNSQAAGKVEGTKTVQVAAQRDLAVEAKLSGLSASNIVFD